MKTPFNIIYELRSVVSRHPLVYLNLARFYHGRNKRVGIVDQYTDIVIEGFPRSATTYAVNAFLLSQGGKKYSIAHHMHSASQIKYATRKNIPVILLIRDPKEAVASLVAREPRLKARSALKEYIGFYNSIAPYLRRTVIGEFREVTGNFSSILDKLNKKFNTGFNTSFPVNGYRDVIFKKIEEQNLDDPNAGQSSEMLVARPSVERNTKLEGIKDDIQMKYGEDLLKKAHKIYYDIIGK